MTTSVLINKGSLNDITGLFEKIYEILLSEVNNNQNIDNIRGTIELLYLIFQQQDKISGNLKKAEILGKSQFLVLEEKSLDDIEIDETSDIDMIIEKHFLSDAKVFKTISDCDMMDNPIFKDSINAFDSGLYNVAIIGLVAVLDRVLAEKSKLICTPRFEKRCEEIKNNIDSKGQLFKDAFSATDAMLYKTYFEVLSTFVTNSDFEDIEPDLINRHWIMHGRTNKKYTRLDCVKIINLICGTIRMGDLIEK